MLGVNVYGVCKAERPVLIIAGLHDPGISSIEINGKVGATELIQNGPIGLIVGVTFD